MLELLNVVINTDAQVIDKDYTYELHYSVSNNEILSLQCVISKETEAGQETIGYIRKESGRVNSDFNEGISMVDHLKKYDLIVKEIEKIMKPI